MKELFRFARALVLGLSFIIAADKLADFRARGNREAIAFQREMIEAQSNQLQRLFQAPAEEPEEP